MAGCSHGRYSTYLFFALDPRSCSTRFGASMQGMVVFVDGLPIYRCAKALSECIPMLSHIIRTRANPSSNKIYINLANTTSPVTTTHYFIFIFFVFSSPVGAASIK